MPLVCHACHAPSLYAYVNHIHAVYSEKVIEAYASRDDFLIYRSVAVDTSPAHTHAQRRHKVFSIALGKSSAELPIRKITEKFARNAKLDAEHDVRKRTHMMMQGEESVLCCALLCCAMRA